MISSIVPRPIAFVSTRSEQGQLNIAPFSFFQMLSHDPPLVMISTSSQNDPQYPDKNTTENIKNTKEFTINVVSDPFIEAMNWSSIEIPSTFSEWHGAGLTPLESELVKPPRIKEAAVNFECHLHSFTDFESSKNLGQRSSTLIIGLVKLIHIRHDVLNEKEDGIDPFKLKPVLRMGGGVYGKFVEAYRYVRPHWNECKDDVEKLYAGSDGSKRGEEKGKSKI